MTAPQLAAFLRAADEFGIPASEYPGPYSPGMGRETLAAVIEGSDGRRLADAVAGLLAARDRLDGASESGIVMLDGEIRLFRVDSLGQGVVVY